MTITNHPTNRKLLNLAKLCKNYRIETINVAYYDPTNENVSNVTIPPTVDLLIKLKAYVAYIPTEDRLIISNNLIGVDNYWLQQLKDDHKNKRIDLEAYTYDR